MRIGCFFIAKFGKQWFFGIRTKEGVQRVYPSLRYCGDFYYRKGNYMTPLKLAYNRYLPVLKTELFRNCFRVCYNGRFGLFLSDGKEILPCRYEDITDCDPLGTVGIKTDGKWGLYNVERGLILVPQYILSRFEADCKGNWIMWEKGPWRLFGTWGDRRDDYVGIMNKDGKIVVPTEYDWVQLNEKGKFEAIIDEETHIYNQFGERLE